MPPIKVKNSVYNIKAQKLCTLYNNKLYEIEQVCFMIFVDLVQHLKYCSHKINGWKQQKGNYK